VSIIRKCSQLFELSDSASAVRYAEAAPLGPPAAAKLSKPISCVSPEFHPVIGPTGIVDVNVLYHSVPELASRQAERAGSGLCTSGALMQAQRALIG
jgi:hypothetical protein